jgi:ankyrin repeat protein
MARDGYVAGIRRRLAEIDVNAPEGKSGWTMLHIAAQRGKPKMADLLLKHGAAVDPRKEDGQTPLHVVASQWLGGPVRKVESLGFPGVFGMQLTEVPCDDRVGVAEVLLAHGADINALDNDKKTPLDLARKFDKKDMIDFLVKKASHST